MISKSLAQEFKNVTEMNDKVMHEAQSYKMSLEASSVHSIALGRARGLRKKLCLMHPHHRSKQEIQKHEHLKIDLRCLISLRKVENMNQISLVSLLALVILPLVIRCEKWHGLVLVKRRHEELERQYQVSIKLKEQEKCLKFKQKQLELH